MLNPLSIIRIGLISATLLSAMGAYTLYLKNDKLTLERDTAQEAQKVLATARVKDAIAAQDLLESTTKERDKLQTSLDGLQEVQDDDGRKYLNTAVPPSVKRLLNSP